MKDEPRAIVTLSKVTSCRKCPWFTDDYSFYRFGYDMPEYIGRCRKYHNKTILRTTNEKIYKKYINGIPSWCPLPTWKHSEFINNYVTR